MGTQKVWQVPASHLLTSREKYENSWWMEQLPAHVWVQDGGSNAVIYSNRLSVRQLASVRGRFCRAKRMICHALKGEKQTCPCCPYQRLAASMRPESCLCRRGGEARQVYHFPLLPAGNHQGGRPIQVLKLEIEFVAPGFRGTKTGQGSNAESEGAETGTMSDGLIKICSACKKVRDTTGAWQELEQYFGTVFGLQFSHGLCWECACQLYPEIWHDRP